MTRPGGNRRWWGYKGETWPIGPDGEEPWPIGPEEEEELSLLTQRAGWTRVQRRPDGAGWWTRSRAKLGRPRCGQSVGPDRTKPGRVNHRWIAAGAGREGSPAGAKRMGTPRGVCCEQYEAEVEAVGTLGKDLGPTLSTGEPPGGDGRLALSSPTGSRGQLLPSGPGEPTATA
ncbi:unnamed protein product [Linum trigynum]|uniref:Uncharacterized protein n=1 Tax=Linum trigynum TaxID=586398 RepID=A0AAV2GJ35_9ROSI